MLSEQCPRCGAEQETLYHRAWACPKNEGHHDYEASQKLFRRASDSHEACPAFWLRGVPPQAWTQPVYDPLRAPKVFT